MSDTNIKLAKDAYAAFVKGDIPRILDMLTPDVTFGIVGRTAMLAAAYHAAPAANRAVSG